MQYTILNALENPEQINIHGDITSRIWPEFMFHDPVSNTHWLNLYKTFSEYQFSIKLNNEIAGFGNCIPLYWDESLEKLPEEGWDWSLNKGFEDNLNNNKPNVLCGLQIAIDIKSQGKGLSYLIVNEMKLLAKNKGYEFLIVPVRPSLKSKYPLIPIESYIQWKDINGLPFDSWLRVHAKLGAKIIKVCHKSMYIPGRIEQWEKWTKLKMPVTGDYVVNGALVPIKADTNKDIAEYTEPNIWVAYDLN